MPFIAFPKVSDWTLASGLEPRGESGIALLGHYQPCDVAGLWTTSGAAISFTGGKLAFANGSLGASYAEIAPASLPSLTKVLPDYIKLVVKVNISQEATTGGPFILLFDSTGAALATFDRYKAGGTWRLGVTGTIRDTITWAPSLNTDYYMMFSVGYFGTNVIVCAHLYADEALTQVIFCMDYHAVISKTLDKIQLYTAGEAAGVWTMDDIRIFGANLATSPVAESPWVATGSGVLDATTPIVIRENVEAARVGTSVGTIKYQYAINNGSYNGSWLTHAQLVSALSGQSITNATNSIRLKIQFNSDGVTACDVSGIGSYAQNAIASVGGFFVI